MTSKRMEKSWLDDGELSQYRGGLSTRIGVGFSRATRVLITRIATSFHEDLPLAMLRAQDSLT